MGMLEIFRRKTTAWEQEADTTRRMIDSRNMEGVILTFKLGEVASRFFIRKITRMANIDTENTIIFVEKRTDIKPPTTNNGMK
jgi:hypothetical protein